MGPSSTPCFGCKRQKCALKLRAGFVRVLCSVKKGFQVAWLSFCKPKPLSPIHPNPMDPSI